MSFLAVWRVESMIWPAAEVGAGHNPVSVRDVIERSVDIRRPGPTRDRTYACVTASHRS